MGLPSLSRKPLRIPASVVKADRYLSPYRYPLGYLSSCRQPSLEATEKSLSCLSYQSAFGVGTSVSPYVAVFGIVPYSTIRLPDTVSPLILRTHARTDFIHTSYIPHPYVVLLNSYRVLHILYFILHYIHTMTAVSPHLAGSAVTVLNGPLIKPTLPFALAHKFSMESKKPSIDESTHFTLR